MAPIVTLACLIAVPGILLSQNYDDHDRSGRYTARSMAKMYLDSVDENGILFTIGDNDTFALWYVQEIEEYRTDVRVINTSLFATDWYIDQMRKAAYKSKAVKTTFEHKDYLYGKNDYVRFMEDPRVKDTSCFKGSLITFSKQSHTQAGICQRTNHGAVSLPNTLGYLKCYQRHQ